MPSSTQDACKRSVVLDALQTKSDYGTTYDVFIVYDFASGSWLCQVPEAYAQGSRCLRLSVPRSQRYYQVLVLRIIGRPSAAHFSKENGEKACQ